MKRRSALPLALVLSLAAIGSDSAAASETGHTFSAGKGTFLMDGKPFVVKAAELHYPRIPRPYWDHRIKMCKALGMNTICLYTFWNIHESEPGVFDFSEGNDLRAFVNLCRENDMYVILRPGPYVCAEWEMGGLPWWLLKDKDIQLRKNDPRFLDAVERFEKAVAREVADLTIDKGGPIIMIQVENEYGSYGKDKEYVGKIRDMLRGEYGEEVTMFQCDWSSNFLDNGLDDLVWTLNFGTGSDPDTEFAPLCAVRPDAPLMCSEYWSGWFDKWGAGHETRPADDMIAGIDRMLSSGISFSLYMTHGGTNYGHWAGANSPGYAPDVTSYDYDAPVSEQGAPTAKYHLLRDLMASRSAEPLPEIPDPIPTGSLEEFTFDRVAPLFDNLPQPVCDTTLRTMEEYDYGYGSIMYSTILEKGADAAVLTIDEAHDFAEIFIDGKCVGTIDRRVGETALSLPPYEAGSRLDILVEAMGRINFGTAIKDFKGIDGRVVLTSGESVTDLTHSAWNVYCLPDTPEFYATMTVAGDVASCVPGLYSATFHISGSEEPIPDTWLDMSSWGKGLVYVNGHPLGRYWNIGPQQTLYLPGCMLRHGENRVEVFDILGPSAARSKGCSAPIYDQLNVTASLPSSAGFDPDILKTAVTLAEDESEAGSGWRHVTAEKTIEGRYAVVTITGEADVLTLAEIYLTDEDGERLNRDSWRLIYADDYEAEGNHTPEKAYDLQESTYWQTGSADTSTDKRHHFFVVDLGTDTRVKGFDYLTHPSGKGHLTVTIDIR